jgi:hypothetical protein
MPTRYKVAVTCLYGIVFALLAWSVLGLRTVMWAVAKFGAFPTLVGVAVWATVLGVSIWAINKINRDWPTLFLPPEPAYSPSEALHEAVPMATQIDMRSAGSCMEQYPSAEEFGQMAEKS